MKHTTKSPKVPVSGLTPASRPFVVDQCQRCGICCTKGGPALHKEDTPLIEKGSIPTKNLFTLRKGEMAIDNVRGHAAPLEDEIIKIKGLKGSWTCCFYNKATRACQVYNARPVECRVLACWDTADIERIYAENRLTRQDLLGAVSGLWDVVQTHEARCAYSKVEKWISKIEKGDQTARVALNEMIAYDRHLRSLTVEKSGIDPALLNFLFGRPLSETLRGRTGINSPL